MDNEKNIILHELSVKLNKEENKPGLEKLTEENAKYYTVLHDVKEELKPLYDCMKPFETKLKEKTGYNKDNVPEKKKIVEIQVGCYTFSMACTKDSDIKYAKAVENIKKYLKDVSERREDRNLKSQGVLFANEKTYILIDDVLAKIDAEIRDNKEKKPKFEISYTKKQ